MATTPTPQPAAAPPKNNEKVLVYSVYPSLSLNLKNSKTVQRANEHGEIVNVEVQQQETAQFAKHRFWCTPDEAAFLKGKIFDKYAVHFILASDLRSWLENPDTRKDGDGFIAKMIAYGIRANCDEKINPMDIYLECGVDVNKLRELILSKSRSLAAAV